MTARDKFRPHQRVQTNTAAEQRPIHTHHQTGMVWGFSRDPHIVMVLLDGRKSPMRFHMDFLEPEGER